MNCWNENLEEQADLSTPVLPKTVAVASYHPNAWGLYDMHGNVDEYCSGSFFSETTKQKTLPQVDSAVVVRGGSAISGPFACQSSSRFPIADDEGMCYIGFRLVLEAESVGGGAQE
jgi:formylglycine-generating enzyme required for sulfatase activity